MDFRNIIDKIGNIVFPEHTTCIICGDELPHNFEHNICNTCLKNLPYNNENICKICGSHIEGMAKICLPCKEKFKTYEMARSPFLYKDNIAFLIQKLKYENGKYIAKPLGYFMAEEYKKNDFNCDCIVPVPLHEKRQKERGYNQAELLGKHLSKYLSIPQITECLYRTKDTPTQTKLNYLQRQKNLENAFKVKNRKLIKGKIVLLIDDVFTTGATIENCAIALLHAGVNKVFALSVAHTLLN